MEIGIIASFNFEVDQFSINPGWSEADTNQWWAGIKAGIAYLFEKSGIKSSQIAGIAVSGMVPALVCIDSTGKALRNSILQNDARAVNQIEILRQKLLDVDLIKKTGSTISQQWIAPTLLWLFENELQIFEQTRSILGSYDWLAHKLGAELHIEQNWALESGLFNLNNSIFHELIAELPFKIPSLPKIKRSGEFVGEVSTEIAIETGLRQGTPIFVGGADHVLSAYGAGVTDSGDALLKLGGAADILVASDKPLADARLYLDYHPIPGKWLPNGCMASSGSILRWEQKLFSGISLHELDQMAEIEKPGTLISLPYFLGEKTPLHDPDLRGVVIGLHIGTTKGEIHRSFLEAIAFGFRHHVEIFKALGISIVEPKITNGGSKSRLWRQILADVLQFRLQSIVDHPGASYGAAVCAGIGSGIIDDWSYAENFLKIEEVIQPNTSLMNLYESRYSDYLKLSEKTAEISHNLSKGQRI